MPQEIARFLSEMALTAWCVNPNIKRLTRRMPNAIFRPIESIWGHFAGAGVNPADTNFIDHSLKEVLAQQAASVP